MMIHAALRMERARITSEIMLVRRLESGSISSIDTGEGGRGERETKSAADSSYRFKVPQARLHVACSGMEVATR